MRARDVTYSKRVTVMARLEADGRERADRRRAASRSPPRGPRGGSATAGTVAITAEHRGHHAGQHGGTGAQAVLVEPSTTATPTTSASAAEDDRPTAGAGRQRPRVGRRDGHRAGAARATPARPDQAATSARPAEDQERPGRERRHDGEPADDATDPGAPRPGRGAPSTAARAVTWTRRTKVTDAGWPAMGWYAGPRSSTSRSSVAVTRPRLRRRPRPARRRAGRRPSSGRCSAGPAAPTAATYTVFSIARARTSVRQWSTLRGPATQAAGTTSTSAPRVDQRARELGEAQVVAGHQADLKPPTSTHDGLDRAGA